MQVAVIPRHAAQVHPRAYSLAQRTALLCGPTFSAHLAAWREALEQQRTSGAVPASYLLAMRTVVASEAAAGAVSADDAIAASVAIAELAGDAAQRTARALLDELAAQGNKHAEILAVAVALASASRATLAQARLDLLAMSGAGSVGERTAVGCLLGEAYLSLGGVTAHEAIAYRFFLAAADENCAAAAVAHFHLGAWYAQERTEADLLLAAHHFERGAELGCAHCLRALGEIHQSTDAAFAHELLELAELALAVPVSLEPRY
jgi:hypothetical protein